MKIGAMNSPRNDLVKEIKWISENGFDFIDLTLEPPKAYDIDIKKVQKALKDFDLKAIGHTNPLCPLFFQFNQLEKFA